MRGYVGFPRRGGDGELLTKSLSPVVSLRFVRIYLDAGCGPSCNANGMRKLADWSLAECLNGSHRNFYDQAAERGLPTNEVLRERLV